MTSMERGIKNRVPSVSTRPFRSCVANESVRNQPAQLKVDCSTFGPLQDTPSSSSALVCSLKIEWLDTEEAASLLRISVKALRNMTSNGQLPFYKLGRRNRYRKDELEAQLLSQKRGK